MVGSLDMMLTERDGDDRDEQKQSQRSCQDLLALARAIPPRFGYPFFSRSGRSDGLALRRRLILLKRPNLMSILYASN